MDMEIDNDSVDDLGVQMVSMLNQVHSILTFKIRVRQIHTDKPESRYKCRITIYAKDDGEVVTRFPGSGYTQD